MQYHYDVVDTVFGKFFILDSSKGLHFLIKYSDSRVKIIKKKFFPIKNLLNSSLKSELEKYLNRKKKSSPVRLVF